MDTTDAAPHFDVTENADAGRFELRRNDELVSYANYGVEDGVIVVPHVETIAEHRGNGYAAPADGRLARHHRRRRQADRAALLIRSRPRP